MRKALVSIVAAVLLGAGVLVFTGQPELDRQQAGSAPMSVEGGQSASGEGDAWLPSGAPGPSAHEEKVTRSGGGVSAVPPSIGCRPGTHNRQAAGIGRTASPAGKVGRPGVLGISGGGAAIGGGARAGNSAAGIGFSGGIESGLMETASSNYRALNPQAPGNTYDGAQGHRIALDGVLRNPDGSLAALDMLVVPAAAPARPHRWGFSYEEELFRTKWGWAAANKTREEMSAAARTEH